MGIESLVFYCQYSIDIGLRQFIDRCIIIDRLNLCRHLFYALFLKCFPVIHVSFHAEHAGQYDDNEDKKRTQTFYPFHSE